MLGDMRKNRRLGNTQIRAAEPAQGMGSGKHLRGPRDCKGNGEGDILSDLQEDTVNESLQQR